MSTLSSFPSSSVLWGVAVAYDNARTPNKSVNLYIGVDVVIGIAMPMFLIAAAITVSVFLEYITGGRIDTRDIISKMLSIQLVKGIKAEYWVIQNIFYFQLNSRDTEVRREIKDRKKQLTCWSAISSTGATWILAIIAALSFLLSVSYFMDQTVTMSLSLQDWPHRSMDDVDCFLSNSFLYVSPIEQEPTDRLNNCTVFFEECRKNCSARSDFQSCTSVCANCLAVCTTALRSDLEKVYVCDPPPVEAPSCPVSNSACITPAIPVPTNTSTSSCPTAATTSAGSGSSLIAPIVARNNTERLERCADLLQTCSELVQSCTAPNCTELQQCNDLLNKCRKPRVILCFRFLQFGRSTDVLEALAESFALFLSVLSFFSGTFVVVRVLLQFKVSRWWGIGFVLVAVLLCVVWFVIIFTDILVQENIIKMFQFVFGFTYIFLIGLLLLTAKFWEKVPDPDKLKTKAHLIPVGGSTSV